MKVDMPLNKETKLMSTYKSNMRYYWQVNDHMEISSLWLNKMGILPRFNHVSTIAWLHHLDFNKILGEKKLDSLLDKDTACYFKLILEAAPYKMAAKQPLNSHPINPPSHDPSKPWQTHEWCSPMDSYTLTPVLTNQQILVFISSAWTGCWLKDLPRMMTNRDRW